MSEVESIRNPVYSSSDQQSIDCIVKFSSLDFEVPFTASPTDVEEHGRKIYEQIISGAAGEIQPYVPKSKPAEQSTASKSGPTVI
jgi:hypothetical protein